MKLFHAKMKVNTCTVCEIGLFTEEEEDVEQIGGFGNFMYVIVTMYSIPPLRLLSCRETLVGHVMSLNGLELLHSRVLSR